MARKPYPSDVKDDEWEFVAPYLALIREDSPQREHDLREIYNALRWVVRAGAPWRMIPNDLPPWAAVYQQVQRWIKAGVFEEMVHDLREILRIAAGREANPTAVVIDSRTLQSTPEIGHCGAYDEAKRKKGSKVHIAVDTLGQLLALHVTPADKQDRSQVQRTIGQHRSTQRDGHRMTRERRRTRRHGLIGVLPTGVTSPRNITPSMFCGDTRTGGYAQYLARRSHELIAIAPRRGRLP